MFTMVNMPFLKCLKNRPVFCLTMSDVENAKNARFY